MAVARFTRGQGDGRKLDGNSLLVGFGGDDRGEYGKSQSKEGMGNAQGVCRVALGVWMGILAGDLAFLVAAKGPFFSC